MPPSKIPKYPCEAPPLPTPPPAPSAIIARRCGLRDLAWINCTSPSAEQPAVATPPSDQGCAAIQSSVAAPSSTAPA